jgi:hypothetical protein
VLRSGEPTVKKSATLMDLNEGKIKKFWRLEFLLRIFNFLIRAFGTKD